ncbi:hypothetical protein A0J48_025925 [Sphaerospermopsis aphanizomenoides BCCUSP55]|uniref:hypothetical protein n=1 Tax=Sphaerospermopsis aphanizomenoides TaxID=459663 RepID=UPI001903E3A6|nr:hypothetical protein [Sphaerospermopsis aphanizomenoides]MBK1990906.1 hypothetical protein [Sphaerospermopsis aphanizomenoides BCCUSP55]
MTINELIEALSEHDAGSVVQGLTATGDAFKIKEITRCKITNNIIINIEPVTGYFLDEE